MTHSYPVATTAELLAMSRRVGRPLDNRLKRRLDPDGVHVVVWSMVHERTGRAEIRAEWLLKVVGQDKPVRATFDVPIKDFNALDRRAPVEP
jgi:hypothetical protein